MPAQTSATAPGTVAANLPSQATGATDWSNPANAITSDNSYATAAVSSGSPTDYLYAYNFGFAIPTNATISGIEVNVERSRSAADPAIRDLGVYLVRRGLLVGTNHAHPTTFWGSGGDTTRTYGDSADMWGVPWTPDEINRLDFGFVISAQFDSGTGSCNAQVDAITIIVYYNLGYTSTPQVQQQGEVYLFGQRYLLANERDGTPGKVRTSLATQFSPKIDTGGPFGRPTNPVHETYEVSDLRGGMGLYRYKDYPKDGQKFWTAHNMDTMWQGGITLATLVTDIDRPSGINAAAQLQLIEDIAGTALFIWKSSAVTRTYTYTSGTWSSALETITNDVYDSIYFNGRLLLALGSNGVNADASPTNGGGSDVTTAAGASDPAALSFCAWDSRVWAIDTTGKLWYSTTGTAAAWTDTAAQIILPSYDFLNLAVYDDSSGDPTIWCHTPFGPFSFDPANSKWFQARFQVPRYARSGLLNPSAAAVFRESLFVQTQDREVYQLTMTGGALAVDRVSIDRPDGAPAEYLGAVKGFARTGDLLFATLGDSAANTDRSWALLCWNGFGWHVLYTNTGAATADYQPVAVVGNTLYFSTVNGDDEIVAASLNLLHLTEPPLFSTTRTYATSGHVELPYYDASAPAQKKVAQEVRLKLLGASSTETVTVAYRVNGSTGAYTTLGQAVAVNREVTVPFGTNGGVADHTGLEFESIQFKLTFASSGSTSAPKLEYFALDFIRQPEVLRGYVLTLDCRNAAYGREPDRMVDDIVGAMKATQFGTFAWRDDANNTRSSLVKVMRFEGEEATGYVKDSTYTLHLLEIGHN